MEEIENSLNKFDNKFFHYAIESVSECISITDSNNIILFVNKAFTKTYGYENNELIGKDISILRHPDDIYITEDILKGTLTGGWHGELSNLRKDGTAFPISLSTSMVTDANGAYFGMIGVATDITAKKEAERAILLTNRQLEKQNEVLIELIKSDIPDFQHSLNKITRIAAETLNIDRVSVWLVDNEQKSLVCNDLFESANGSHQSGMLLEMDKLPAYFEALTQKRSIISPDVLYDPLTTELKATYLEPLGIKSMLDSIIWHREMIKGIVCFEQLSHRDWKMEEVSFSRSIADQVTFFLERKERLMAELALREKEKSLTELNATKDKFFSIIAHDLKSPFNSILGFSNLLFTEYENYTDEERKSFIRNIYESAKSTSRLLVNLLEWAKMQLGKFDFKPERLDVSAMVNDTILLLKGTAVVKNIRLISEVSYGMEVIADENMVKTVLRNLVSNAIQFTGNGGLIRIYAKYLKKEHDKQGFVEISIADNGIGISQENINKIFFIGEKLQINDAQFDQGSGLGLILCKEFVLKCGGDIYVTSTENQGSTFSFTLPA